MTALSRDQLQHFAHSLETGSIINRRFLPRAHQHVPHPQLAATIRRMRTTSGEPSPSTAAVLLAVCGLHGLPVDAYQMPQRLPALIALRYDAALALSAVRGFMSQRDIAQAVGYTGHNRIGIILRQFRNAVLGREDLPT